MKLSRWDGQTGARRDHRPGPEDGGKRTAPNVPTVCSAGAIIRKFDLRFFSEEGETAI